MTPADASAFAALGVSEKFLPILAQRGISQPTPIQLQAIPIATEGKDVIGIAQTGTGKTLAFGLPMLQRLAAQGGGGLVLVPTRELAAQVEESLRAFANAVSFRTIVIIGGASMRNQINDIRQKPRIVVATPGRLNDHLEQGTITLRGVTTLVLDEADQMLDMGFMPQIERILSHIPAERQTLLFSATMPPEITKLAARHMKMPLRVEVAPAGTAAENVEQEMIFVAKADKLTLLQHLLSETKGRVLVFSRTKHGASKMAKALMAAGYTAAEIHANRSLGQRKAALEGFKSGKHRVLVATDIAARGIHVTGVELVVNFDLPDDSSDYVHRIGRTARAGTSGKAISFASPDQARDVSDIERLIRTSIKRGSLPKHIQAPAVASHASKSSPGPKFNRRGNGGQRSGSNRHFGGRR